MIKKRQLNKAIRIAGNQSLLAARLEISRQYLSEIKRGIRPFPKKRESKLLEIIGQ